jgi:hypothetical protein
MPKPNLKPGSLERCPLPLKRLIEKFEGDREKAAASIGMKPSSFGHLTRGAAEISKVMASRIEAVLSGTPIANDAPKVKTKTPRSAKNNRGGRRDRKEFKNPPPLLAKLLKKFDGNKSAAGRACGHAIDWVNRLGHREQQLKDHDRLAIQKALSDGAASEPNSEPEEIAEETGQLGIVIVLAKTQGTKALYNAAEALGGKCLFRKHVGQLWLTIYRLEPDKIVAYREVAKVVATAVMTP